MKKFFNKVKEGLVKACGWIKNHIIDIFKALVGIGVSAIVMGAYTANGDKSHKVKYAVEYVGALTVAALLTEAATKHIDAQVEEYKQSIETMRQAVAGLANA